MAENSNISWCDHTHNEWIGCTKVSQGCKHCYAESFMTRKPRWANTWGPTGIRLRTSEANRRKPYQWNKQLWSECQQKCGWRGDIQKVTVGTDGYFHCPQCNGLTTPVGARVFCSSLSDVFEDNPQLVDWRAELFEKIRATPNLDWLLLTKRPENVNRMIADIYGDCYWLEDYGQNIWIGTSVEDQEQADKRIPALLDIPARIRFLSCEPLLGPVDLAQSIFVPDVWDRIHPDHNYSLAPSIYQAGIHWVIVGGESGPNARPMHPNWARSIRDQCQSAGIPFLFKQWSGVNKHAAGNLLDGVKWEQFPE